MKKFKAMFYLIMMGVMMYAPTAFAVACKADKDTLNIITSSKTIPVDAQIPNLIHLVVVVLEIAIPVILVILGMIDLLKGVAANKEDEVKKGQQMFIKRLIAAALVFLVFTVVSLIINVADSKGENVMDCANCFINGIEKCME